MTRITRDNIRALIDTNLTDDDLDNIIELANKEVNIKSGSTLNNDKLYLAELYLACALTLRKMKTNGELPDSQRVGEITQSVDIDSIIVDYENKANLLIKQYIISSATFYKRAEIDWSNKNDTFEVY